MIYTRYTFSYIGEDACNTYIDCELEYEIDFLFTPHLHLIIIVCIQAGHIHYIYTNGVNGVYVISNIHLIYSSSIFGVYDVVIYTTYTLMAYMVYI